jgi:hypothetical protein
MQVGDNDTALTLEWAGGGVVLVSALAAHLSARY